MIELSIKVSNDEAHLTKKYLLHDEGLVLSKDDRILKAYVEQAISEFQGNVDDVVVKIKFIW